MRASPRRDEAGVMAKTVVCACCDREFSDEDQHWFRLEEGQSTQVCVWCIKEALSIYVGRRIVELRALSGFLEMWESQYKQASPPELGPDR
jgi:hypothetical protein